MKAWYAVTAALALAGASALFVSSCSTLDRSVVEPPRIEGAHFVGNKTCADCHTNIARMFPASPHARFYKDDLKWAAMAGCEQCHDPHGSDIMKPRGGLAMARLNENCAQCHREQARPFVFEHEALREGCTVCHAPHGSINSKLLVQRDANLCLKCHAQTQSVAGRMFIGKQDHSSFVSLGACWSAGCHPAIHGSNTSRRMHY